MRPTGLRKQIANLKWSYETTYESWQQALQDRDRLEAEVDRLKAVNRMVSAYGQALSDLITCLNGDRP